MFHIALTGGLGKSQDPGWYEIGVYSTSFFVRLVQGTNRWGSISHSRDGRYEFGR
jgi:hypothetical protein